MIGRRRIAAAALLLRLCASFQGAAVVPAGRRVTLSRPTAFLRTFPQQTSRVQRPSSDSEAAQPPPFLPVVARWRGQLGPLLVQAVVLCVALPLFALRASASAALPVEETFPSLTRGCLFLALFTLSALLHSAEVAITTLYPWKVKEFAEEEGPRSSFATLDVDITRALTSILVATTFSNVLSTALFADCATTFLSGETKALAMATGVLTAATLFFGEMLPKAVGVNNAEKVARTCLPAVNLMSVVLGPVGSFFSVTSKFLLQHVFRVDLRRGALENAVSEEELRLIVGGATQSGGIESKEGSMIEGVLDLQDTRVAEIMRPRVEVDALEENDSMLALLDMVNATGHSRIPVYREDIDNVVGVVNAKKLLDVVKKQRKHNDVVVDQDVKKGGGDVKGVDENLQEGGGSSPSATESLVVKDYAEPTYFVPQTMFAWKVLEEMRKRRLHMAIVVDEFGGTAGMVTLEDILEVVVGDIYDEDDQKELDEKDAIHYDEDDDSFAIPGTAAVDDLVEAIGLPKEDVKDLTNLPDVTTAAGFVCYFAGEIPAAGDHVFVANYDFEVEQADERRIFLIRARNIEHLDFSKPMVVPSPSWEKTITKEGGSSLPPPTAPPNGSTDDDDDNDNNNNPPAGQGTTTTKLDHLQPLESSSASSPGSPAP